MPARPAACWSLPARTARIGGALFGLGKGDDETARSAIGALAKALPEGDWHFATTPDDPTLAALGLVLGGYASPATARSQARTLRFALPDGADAARVERIADGVFLARDLVNTPTNDMGPDALEAGGARRLPTTHKAKVSVDHGRRRCSKQNFPMIHAVGRASAEAPRLIDMAWGDEGRAEGDAGRQGRLLRHRRPRHQAVERHAADEEGHGRRGQRARPRLDDHGGAAEGRLRVLIPAVENAISGNAFRPGDVLTSRKGITVEIGNTDAEGRLVLADALALADEEEPELLIDMATLTGAARVALGPDLPPFYTDDDALAAELAAAARAVERSAVAHAAVEAL